MCIYIYIYKFINSRFELLQHSNIFNISTFQDFNISTFQHFNMFNMFNISTFQHLPYYIKSQHFQHLVFSTFQHSTC